MVATVKAPVVSKTAGEYQASGGIKAPQRPDTPFNRRLMHAALTSLRGRPSAEQIINAHIEQGLARGECFDAPAGQVFR